MPGVIKYLILPSSLIIIFSIVGSLLLLTKRARRFSILILAMTGTLYIVFGSGPVSLGLLGNLENQHPSLRLIGRARNVDTIVVLAGHAKTNRDRPISSEVNSASAFRAIEALRIFRIIPEVEILVSGAKDTPEIIKKLLIALGAPADKILLEDDSADTYMSALNLKETLGARPFILVTSAGHMPRAIGVFRKMGLKPIPAPTDYKVTKTRRAIGYVPSPTHLEYSDLAVYEYLGIFWYRLKNLSTSY
jgi:uncharacterized SAM-binding protein YcdF (DUF218 family)